MNFGDYKLCHEGFFIDILLLPASYMLTYNFPRTPIDKNVLTLCIGIGFEILFIRKLIVPFLVISALFDLLLIHFEPMAQKERALTLGASARLTS